MSIVSIVSIAAFVVTAAAGCGSKKDDEASASPKLDDQPAASQTAISITVDGQQVTTVTPPADGERVALLGQLPEAHRDLAAWAKLDGHSPDGRTVTAASPATAYPGIRFEIALPKGRDAPTLWLVQHGASDRSRVISTLPDVERINITTVEAAKRAAAERPPPPTLELVIGESASTLSWADIDKLPATREKGMKHEGHRLRQVLDGKVEPSTVAKIIVKGETEHVVPGNVLASGDQFGFLRLNRSGMVRFRHYKKAATEQTDRKKRYEELGGVRNVRSLLIELKADTQ